MPKLSRLEIKKGADTKTVAVKVSTAGRISFHRDDDGKYPVLGEVDLVIHAQPVPDDPDNVRLMAFDRDTVIQAFEENHSSLAAHGMGHIPHWINPVAEPKAGWRLTGSGFGKKALWTAVTPIVAPASTASPSPEPTASAPAGGIMDRIKQMLADHMGVAPDDLLVEVHLKR